MTEAYRENDPNLLIATTLNAPDIAFHDIRTAPVDVYGFYDYQHEPYFHRLPFDVAQNISQGVFNSQRESSGARVRFTTDSEYVAIHADYVSVGRSSHLSLENSAGFDLYEDTHAGSRFVKLFLPPYDMKDSYAQIVHLGSRRQRSFTINFPVHSIVKDLAIGLQQDATISHGAAYPNAAPVVIYGSSIVHGTAASRPGLIYPNIISRKLNLSCSCYGFSGQAKGEPAMAQYLASLPMSIFVCDYDHNAPDPQHLEQTHYPFYQIIREQQPDVPYIMISRPDVVTGNRNDCYARRDIIIDSFRKARANGDNHVYFIDGESFYRGYAQDDCTMDGCHPNDLGFQLMADKIACVIADILKQQQ